MIDILAALNEAKPEATGQCALQRNLDTIPTETPGLDQLHAAVDNRDGMSAPRLGKVLAALGIGVSVTTIRAHRAGTCACYIRG